MKGKKLEIFWNKISLTGCKWSSLNAPGSHAPWNHFLAAQNDMFHSHSFSAALSRDVRPSATRAAAAAAVAGAGRELSSGCICDRGDAAVQSPCASSAKVLRATLGLLGLILTVKSKDKSEEEVHIII